MKTSRSPAENVNETPAEEDTDLYVMSLIKCQLNRVGTGLVYSHDDRNLTTRPLFFALVTVIHNGLHIAWMGTCGEGGREGKRERKQGGRERK